MPGREGTLGDFAKACAAVEGDDHFGRHVGRTVKSIHRGTYGDIVPAALMHETLRIKGATDIFTTIDIGFDLVAGVEGVKVQATVSDNYFTGCKIGVAVISNGNTLGNDPLMQLFCRHGQSHTIVDFQEEVDIAGQIIDIEAGEVGVFLDDQAQVPVAVEDGAFNTELVSANLDELTGSHGQDAVLG